MKPTPLPADLKAIWRNLRGQENPPSAPPPSGNESAPPVKKSQQTATPSPKQLEDLPEDTLSVWENIKRKAASSMSGTSDHKHQPVPLEESREYDSTNGADEESIGTVDGSESSVDPSSGSGYSKLPQNEQGEGKGVPRATLKQAFGATLRSLVGTGILFLPHGVSQAGLAGAAPVFVISCGLVVLGCTRLIQCWTWYVTDEEARSGVPAKGSISFPALAKFLIGPFWARILEMSIVGIQLGACVAYLVFVSDSVHEVMRLFSMEAGKPAIMILMAIFEVPLCCLRDLSFLSHYNSAANLIILICIGLLVLICFSKLASDGVAPGVNPGFSPSGFIMFLGTLTYSFEGAAVVIPIANTLDPKDRDKFSSLYMWTLLALSFVYVGFSTLGYCAFGSHVGVMITISLEDSVFPSGFIRFFWAVAVVFTFPLQMFPVSELADKLFFGVQPPVSDKPDQMRMLAGTVIRCCLVVLVWLMAVAGSKHLGHFIALVGGLCGAPMALVLPPMMHTEVLNRKEANVVAALAEAKKNPSNQSREKDLDDQLLRLAELNSIFRGRDVNTAIMMAGGVITVVTTTLALATWSSGAD